MSKRRRPARPRRPVTGRARAWILPGLLGAAVLAAALVLVGTGSSAPPAGAPASRPVLGSAAAPILIQEYGDFQCPSCGAFARSIAPQIRQRYIDPGIVRLEWHDFAWIGTESRDAANAARCAGAQGRFWEYHDLLYSRQGGENRGAFSKDRLKRFGTELGLDRAAFEACVDGGHYVAAVQADTAQVRSLGMTGTPTFLVGSRRIVGAQPFAVFAAAIDAELARR